MAPARFVGSAAAPVAAALNSVNISSIFSSVKALALLHLQVSITVYCYDQTAVCLNSVDISAADREAWLGAQVHVGAGVFTVFLGSFSMANTAITSNRAVPGKNMAPKFKKKKKKERRRNKKAKAFRWSNKISNLWIYFSSPLFSLYFFLFHPWTALLCYDCISYEGSVSGTGSGPHRRKDCTSKPLTGTSGDGAGECLLSVFNISLWDLWQWCLNPPGCTEPCSLRFMSYINRQHPGWLV